MIPKIPRLAVLALIVLLPGIAFGYGPMGHEVVGNLAEAHLKGTRAETEVRALLKSETLARATTWADRAKFPDKYLSDEMKEFVAKNPDHHSFHYCDVPFQQTQYRDGGTGTNPIDIVHTMQLCIRVLQKGEVPEAKKRGITPRIAMMLLAHLVGDIHQPLHVGCGYVDANDEFVNPDKGEKGQEDAGGNHLKINARTPLHGYWDTVAVKSARARAPGQDLKAYLLQKHPPQAAWKPRGPIETWPKLMADDALPFSKEAYRGLKLSNRRTEPANEKRPAHDEWKVTLPADYDERAASITELGLAKAGYRLAELYKAIWP